MSLIEGEFCVVSCTEVQSLGSGEYRGFVMVMGRELVECDGEVVGVGGSGWVYMTNVDGALKPKSNGFHTEWMSRELVVAARRLGIGRERMGGSKPVFLDYVAAVWRRMGEQGWGVVH